MLCKWNGSCSAHAIYVYLNTYEYSYACTWAACIGVYVCYAIQCVCVCKPGHIYSSYVCCHRRRHYSEMKMIRGREGIYGYTANREYPIIVNHVTCVRIRIGKRDWNSCVCMAYCYTWFGLCVANQPRGLKIPYKCHTFCVWRIGNEFHAPVYDDADGGDGEQTMATRNIQHSRTYSCGHWRDVHAISHLIQQPTSESAIPKWQ